MHNISQIYCYRNIIKCSIHIEKNYMYCNDVMVLRVLNIYFLPVKITVQTIVSLLQSIQIPTL